MVRFDEGDHFSFLGEEALQAVYNECMKKSSSMTELIQKPYIRPAKVWTRPTVDRKRGRDGKVIYNWQPHANCEAALIHSRGEIAPEPCDFCSAKRGRFAECVVMPGMFKGACGNCRWASKDASCSLRKDKEKDM
ncbi:hypothetical protein B0T21DRAFT_299479 [Apiosordaria backusii]|uniref:Uncharacterized protein n=1 Tax=Apiosordaria backusii TaxID=314023 RepID=A0AA39ZUW6_9PEZI|nr:hypothetical protein B0T21DRAFT_299479 [Apiosordaria backusii]